MKYYNENDGKLYDTVEALEAAEQKRKEAEVAKKAKAEQKESRLKEVKDAYRHYYDLVTAYRKDYGDLSPLESVFDFILNS